MTATKLTTKRVEKVWGRRDLAPWFPDVADGGAPVGEIWFEAAGDPALLVKYLFTSERLSVQVHPDDAQARAAGLPRGKDEAWVILAAEPGATIAIGLKAAHGRDEVEAAAKDGSLDQMMDWRPVHAGDVIYSPSGTVHAIGAGLTLVEVQQNSDTTYRLYDYGRPRELHLAAGLAVSHLEPFKGESRARDLGDGRTMIVEAAKLSIERWRGMGTGKSQAPLSWVTVIAGGATLGGAEAAAGETWIVPQGCAIERDGETDLLVSYPA